MRKSSGLYGIVYLIVCVLLLVGEVRCIYKCFTCNWEPIGKAEAVYTISACTGLGAVVGYFNIEDK